MISLQEYIIDHIEYEYRWYNNIIYENYGIFNGAKEAADLVYTSLKTTKTSYNIDCKNICSFFDKIHLILK